MSVASTYTRVYAQLLAYLVVLALDDSAVSVQELVHSEVADGPVQGEVEVSHLVLRRDAGDGRDEPRQQGLHARFAGHSESRRHASRKMDVQALL